MRLYLDVTWPLHKSVGPLPRSGTLAGLLQRDLGKLRPDLVYLSGNRLYIRGLFGRESVVPDADRYEIVRVERAEAGRAPSQQLAGAIAVTAHQITQTAPIQPTASGHRSPLVSTYPYVDRPVALGCDRPTLVIVLESPHRDEYGRGIDDPISPRGAGLARVSTSIYAMY